MRSTQRSRIGRGSRSYTKMAACLMMSNLADELKLHAVTLYEVGKIPHEALDAFVGGARAHPRQFLCSRPAKMDRAAHHHHDALDSRAGQR